MVTQSLFAHCVAAFFPNVCGNVTGKASGIMLHVKGIFVSAQLKKLSKPDAFLFLSVYSDQGSVAVTLCEIKCSL